MARLTAKQNIERAIGAKEERLWFKMVIGDLIKLYGRDVVLMNLQVQVDERERVEKERLSHA